MLKNKDYEFGIMFMFWTIVLYLAWVQGYCRTILGKIIPTEKAIGGGVQRAPRQRWHGGSAGMAAAVRSPYGAPARPRATCVRCFERKREKKRAVLVKENIDLHVATGLVLHAVVRTRTTTRR